jgi:hypothetical protein
MNVDLFDPPQREKYREQVMQLRQTTTEKNVARLLGVTVTAVQRAASLQRMMDAIGATDPYVPLTEPPVDYAKLRRHHHKRYDFQPLPDAGKT